MDTQTLAINTVQLVYVFQKSLVKCYTLVYSLYIHTMGFFLSNSPSLFFFSFFDLVFCTFTYIIVLSFLEFYLIVELFILIAGRILVNGIKC